MRKKPHGAAFKFKVAIEALKGEKTTAELCSEYGVAGSQIFKWRKAPAFFAREQLENRPIKARWISSMRPSDA